MFVSDTLPQEIVDYILFHHKGLEHPVANILKKSKIPLWCGNITFDNIKENCENYSFNEREQWRLNKKKVRTYIYNKSENLIYSS